MPALVALSRTYRGEHHPADVLGSKLFSALWITALTLLIKPGQPNRSRADPAAAGRSRERGGRRGLTPPAPVRTVRLHALTARQTRSSPS